MQVILNENGTRNRDFRPYISEEQQGNSIYLWDPNVPFHYGLYDTAQPSCGSWLDIYYQYPSKIPLNVITRTGRTFLVQPNWFNHGYKYQSLLRHARP